MLGKEQLSQGVDKCGGEGGDGMQRRIPYFEVVHRRSYDHTLPLPRDKMRRARWKIYSRTSLQGRLFIGSRSSIPIFPLLESNWKLHQLEI